MKAAKGTISASQKLQIHNRRTKTLAKYALQRRTIEKQMYAKHKRAMKLKDDRIALLEHKCDLSLEVMVGNEIRSSSEQEGRIERLQELEAKYKVRDGSLV